MASSLRENYNSEYVRQSNLLTGKPQVVEVWVEDEYDVPFWNDLLNRHDGIEFRFTPYRSHRLNKGKGDILKYAAQLGPHLIACVDSDYDYLLPDSSEAGRELRDNPYILHTITYAIENWNCHPATLERICVNATLSDPDFDFVAFYRAYSEAIYPLLLWSLMFRKEKMAGTLAFSDFKAAVDIPVSLTKDNWQQAVARVRRSVNARVKAFDDEYPRLKAKMPSLESAVAAKGVARDNCFLFINGHVLEDIITQRLLAPLCRRTVRRHIEKIFSSRGSMNEKTHRKAHYDNITRRSLSVLLASNFEYKAYSRLYDQVLRPKVERMIGLLTAGGNRPGQGRQPNQSRH